MGKAAIGIDIANKEPPIVTVREMIESREFKESLSDMTFVAGCNIVGEAIVDDIVNMPHLFVAGVTGSGKTVFLRSVIMSILFKSNPANVKMILIDTKGVSLTIYNGAPHLLIPVVTDASKSLATLRWVLSEVEDRYRKFADLWVRDLKGYNKSDRIPHKMPRTLIVIDDLSDLMAYYKREAEQLIVRIAQISRGAEELLGNGDMLFKLQGCMKPVPIQGAYISDEEIEDVINFLKNQFPFTEISDNLYKKKEYNVEYDRYFEIVGRFVIERNKASIDMIQRAFKIGFNRAVRIMEQLYEAGVVGEESGTKPREI